MNFHLISPLIPFAIGIILKILLDRNLGSYVVKFFWWIPVRSIFRMKVDDISGKWCQIWDNTLSMRYPAEEGRKSYMKIRQFGSYIYAEFRSNNDEQYYIYGELIGRNIIGRWRDIKNDLGYFGAFEVRIVDSKNIRGIWCGHSNEKPDEIYTDKWNWTR